MLRCDACIAGAVMGRQGVLDDEDEDENRSTPRGKRIYGKEWPRSGSKHATNAMMQLAKLDVLVWICDGSRGRWSWGLVLDPPCCTHDSKDRKRARPATSPPWCPAILSPPSNSLVALVVVVLMLSIGHGVAWCRQWEQGHDSRTQRAPHYQKHHDDAQASHHAVSPSIALGRLRQVAAFNKREATSLPYSNLHSLCVSCAAYLLSGDKRMGIALQAQPSAALGTERYCYS